MTKQELGSFTAKGGFINEKEICKKFNNYLIDKEAQLWLYSMGYDFNKIDKVTAVHIPVRISLKTAINLGISQKKYEESIKFKKADIQIKLEILINSTIFTENISLKKANKSARYNQIDKRPVNTYQKIWNFNNNIAKWLKAFTGEILPKNILSSNNLLNIKDQRRLFLYEIPTKDLNKIIDFFKNNKLLVISDIIRGRGELSADYVIVTQKIAENEFKWIIKDINFVCNFYSIGEVRISPRGSLKIGKITMQRKGGTPDPTSLQFKINPLELFND